MAETDFFSLAKIEKHPRTRIRLLALGYVKQGKLRNEIAQMFCITTQAIREWVNRFISNGLEGLQEGFRSGRRKKYRHHRKKNLGAKLKNCSKNLKEEELGQRIFK